MSARPRLLPSILCLALLAGCERSVTGPVPIEGLPRALDVSEQALVRAGNDFAFQLLRTVSEAEGERNLFLSPLSASMALGMALNGAAGETRDAMRRTLGFGDLELQRINASYRSLIDLLLGLDRSIQVGIANSVWYRNTFTFQPAFLDDVRQHFGARIEALDFDDPRSVGIVNGWVKEQTGGRIPEILERIQDGDAMYLINAIYFKAPWVDRFDPSATRDAPFFLADGSQKLVRTMSREKGRMRIFRDGAATVLDLPYGGGAYSMTIVLPEGGRTLDDLVAGLDAATWAGWMERLADAEIGLTLPRFRLEYEIGLRDALEALGMGIAFTDRADFTRMHPPGGLLISSVKQKTFVEVHEEGTEAAAVTKVTIGLTSAPMPVRVDRPFIVAIRERFSGTILFIGKVMDPTAG